MTEEPFKADGLVLTTQVSGPTCTCGAEMATLYRRYQGDYVAMLCECPSCGKTPMDLMLDRQADPIDWAELFR